MTGKNAETIRPCGSLTKIMTALDYLRDGLTQIVNTNRLVQFYDGCTGLKYSYSDESGHSCAVSAERDGNSYTAVLMGFKDKDELFAKAKELLSFGFTAYSCVNPTIPDEFPDYINVRGGLSPKVRTSIDEDIRVIIPNGRKSSIVSRISAPEYVYAPLKVGDKLGEISFYLDGELIYFGDIKAKTNIKSVTFQSSLLKFLKYLI